MNQSKTFHNEVKVEIKGRRRMMIPLDLKREVATGNDTTSCLSNWHCSDRPEGQCAVLDFVISRGRRNEGMKISWACFMLVTQNWRHFVTKFSSGKLLNVFFSCI